MPKRKSIVAERSEFQEEILFEPHGAENEEDLEPKKYAEAVTWATDWTTETLVLQLRKGTIDLNPEFQRRDAWTDNKKSQFIESIMLGLPIPQIVLAERKDRKGTYIVIDGKQRLLSLARFCIVTDEQTAPGLTLDGLKILKKLNEINYSEMNNNSRFARELEAFHGQTIRTVVIKNWPNEDFLYTVFLRLNSNSVPLSPQELRKALHPGPFLNYLDVRTAESKTLLSALGLKKPDFRMRDVEIAVRYFAFKNFSENYGGNLKEFLDRTCYEFNKSWRYNKEGVERQFKEMERAIDVTERIFGKKHAFRKFTSQGYETRLNRAVFDIFLFYFSNQRVAEAAEGKAKDIKTSFEKLCIDDPAFKSSLETSTKTTSVVHKRFTTWEAEVRKVTKASVNRYEGPR
jgi:hypothetical protein